MTMAWVATGAADYWDRLRLARRPTSRHSRTHFGSPLQSFVHVAGGRVRPSTQRPETPTISESQLTERAATAREKSQVNAKQPVVQFLDDVRQQATMLLRLSSTSASRESTPTFSSRWPRSSILVAKARMRPAKQGLAPWRLVAPGSAGTLDVEDILRPVTIARKRFLAITIAQAVANCECLTL